MHGLVGRSEGAGERESKGEGGGEREGGTGTGEERSRERGKGEIVCFSKKSIFTTKYVKRLALFSFKLPPQ